MLLLFGLFFLVSSYSFSLRIEAEPYPIFGAIEGLLAGRTLIVGPASALYDDTGKLDSDIMNVSKFIWPYYFLPESQRQSLQMARLEEKVNKYGYTLQGTTLAGANQLSNSGKKRLV